MNIVTISTGKITFLRHLQNQPLNTSVGYCNIVISCRMFNNFLLMKLYLGILGYHDFDANMHLSPKIPAPLTP